MAYINEIYDTLFAPNTICVASISYGKDSLAMLRAIKLLGLPLHRIIHSEVWATDTIPADLPPMVEFKRRADEIIKALYGIEVEHICATRPVSEAERERETEFTKESGARETPKNKKKTQNDRERSGARKTTSINANITTR